MCVKHCGARLPSHNSLRLVVSPRMRALFSLLPLSRLYCSSLSLFFCLSLYARLRDEVGCRFCGHVLVSHRCTQCVFSNKHTSVRASPYVLCARLFPWTCLHVSRVSVRKAFLFQGPVTLLFRCLQHILSPSTSSRFVNSTSIHWHCQLALVTRCLVNQTPRLFLKLKGEVPGVLCEAVFLSGQWACPGSERGGAPLPGGPGGLLVGDFCDIYPVKSAALFRVFCDSLWSEDHSWSELLETELQNAVQPCSFPLR